MRISSHGINRPSCPLQRAAESTEERNNSAIADAHSTIGAAAIFRPASGSINAAPSPTGGRSMRSLWRMIATRWLGGQGSEALTGDSAVLDLLKTGESTQASLGFQVRRQSGISHQAMISRQVSEQATVEPVIVEKSGGDRSG